MSSEQINSVTGSFNLLDS